MPDSRIMSSSRSIELNEFENMTQEDRFVVEPSRSSRSFISKKETDRDDKYA